VYRMELTYCILFVWYTSLDFPLSNGKILIDLSKLDVTNSRPVGAKSMSRIALTWSLWIIFA
jgi:hypothetical protein